MNNNKKPLRILHVLGSLATGGVEAFVLNMYRNIDTSVIQFDFVICTNNGYCIDYEKEILKRGGKIYKIKNGFIGLLKFAEILKQNKYEIVHCHRGVIGIIYLLTAYFCGVNNRISHSHNNSESGFLKKFLTTTFKCFLRMVSTICFSCGEEAGVHQFGSNNFIVIKNGIDINKYRYNEIVCHNLRKEFCFNEDEIIVGHVGRFEDQKNHSFIIDVFDEFHKIVPNSKLVLIGNGSLIGKIEDLVARKNLSKNVFFLRNRHDVNQLLQMFNIILFPSLYEGFSVAMVEMQAAGLRILSSDVVPNEINITGEVYFENLDTPANIWAEKLKSLLIYKRTKVDVAKLVKAGLDVKASSEKLSKIYLSMI